MSVLHNTALQHVRYITTSSFTQITAELSVTTEQIQRNIKHTEYKVVINVQRSA